MAAEPNSFLPYHEPGIVTILVQSSLLLVLNIVNTAFDKLIFCGLLGQVFIGVAWGTPGAKWLGQDVEDVIVQLGYMGLILLVYEGGLDTNFRSLKANLFLSVAVAITGICLPMAFSFILQSMANASPLQAFAAGAALCSTSLGTTFTILNTSGLSSTRLGVVLSSAAMMDDVVGLVMVQVISNLGESSDSFNAVTVVRPLAVSFGLAISVPLVCRFIVQPLTTMLNDQRKSRPSGQLARACQTEYTAFIIHTMILLGLVAAATYAGTSNLFAAYLAGASVSWWDSEVPHIEALPSSSRVSSGSGPDGETANEIAVSNQVQDDIATTGAAVYHRYYSTAVQRVLKPFFFASIGFAIPITDMFTAEMVWKGIVYTLLMLLAKLSTGIWLIRLKIPVPKASSPRSIRTAVKAPMTCFTWMYGGMKKFQVAENMQELHPQSNDATIKDAGQTQTPNSPTENTPSTSSPETSTIPASQTQPKFNKPVSLYPAAMLGTAMIARGEIGFLIASLAETTGLFANPSSTQTGSSQIYLIVTWAIVLCTIIGPLGIGTLVKRVRRLQNERVSGAGRSDPLGIWGVN